PLAKPAIEAIEKDEVRILTEQHKKIALHFLRNIEDWNISRQIAWGIPIPAWHKNGEWKITEASPGEGWTQDPDTFDTWFSSGQWPFVTLGFPDGKDFKTFYPTSVMETGADILFFWVARMVMLGLYRTGKVPFRSVYLHGLVRDAKGQKMSKSKGNVISPLNVTEKFGTDALRMGLVVGNTPGTDLNLDPQKVGAYKKFANKLWNIARFILTETEDFDPASKPAVTSTDSALLARLDEMAKDVTGDLENFRYHLAAEKLYHYVWHELADKVIEESKPILKGDDAAARASRQHALLAMLETSLKLLHPFMPFLTEEIWQSMPRKDAELLMVSPWPAH
ncbi:MAG: class I tRNA ligase family protein, partial [Patescibacteria group bacterium]